MHTRVLRTRLRASAFRRSTPLRVVGLTILGVVAASVSNALEDSYDIVPDVEIPPGTMSSEYWVQITGAPANAVITNVEAKFDYIAYGVVQDYVSARFNRGSDPGQFGGVSLVSQGSLPPGNPGTYGYVGFSNWNGQGVNTNYYFRFLTAAGSPFSHTIQKIYVRVTYVTPPPAPTLASPANLSVRVNQTPHQFDWSSVAGATKYRVYVDNHPGFGSPEINQEPTSSDLTSFASLPDNVYHWKAQAYTSAGWGPWSSTWMLAVDTAPPAPSIASPADGAQYTEGQTAPLSWSGPAGFSIDRYYLRVVQGTDLNASPYYEPPEGYFTSDSVDLTGWPVDTYTWGIRAIKDHPSGFNQSTYETTIGWGNYATRTFEVVPGPFDLTVTVDALPANSAQQGSNVTITCTVTRTGSVMPSAGPFVRLYLYLGQSPSSVAPGDPQVAGETEQFDILRTALDDGQETAQKTVTIPATIEGPFYAHAVVDGPDFWDESDDGNNLGSSSTTLAIWRPGGPLTNEPYGLVARTYDDSTVYWIKYGNRWPIPEQSTFFGLGYTDADVEWYASGALDALPTGKTILLDDDDFVYRSQTVSTVYIIRNGASDWFLNYAAFLASGFTDEDVYWTTDAGVAWIQSAYPLGQLVDTLPRIRVEPSRLDFE